MIRVTDIVKSYGQIAVLNNVNLTIVHKEVVAIVGPSGSGKSTLLQILGTLGKPDSGQVIINDVDVFNLSADELARFRNQQIGFVFQFHHLLPEFTALENVCIPAYIAKKSQKEATARAKELLSYLGLSERLTHKPKELSGGEQQRVAIARAMMNEPAILLADEPSVNLDSHNREEIHQLFFKLRDELNQTIVLVTHDADLANMSDRKLTMRDGRFIN